MHIYIIDDDLEDLELFADVLHTVNPQLQCVAFYDTLAALHELRAGIRMPAVIFIDYEMPKLNGAELLVLIRKENGLKETPVVIYSTARPLNDEFINNNDTFYLQKQSSYTDMVTDMRATLKMFDIE